GLLVAFDRLIVDGLDIIGVSRFWRQIVLTGWHASGVGVWLIFSRCFVSGRIARPLSASTKGHLSPLGVVLGLGGRGRRRFSLAFIGGDERPPQRGRWAVVKTARR